MVSGNTIDLAVFFVTSTYYMFHHKKNNIKHFPLKHCFVLQNTYKMKYISKIENLWNL